jgi:hypothetical protein
MKNAYGRMEMSKSSQLSAPSDKKILWMVSRMVDRISRRRTFNGHRVNKQVFLNCIMVGLEELGEEQVYALFNLGASIFGQAIMENEPGSPAAFRELRQNGIAPPAGVSDLGTVATVRPLQSAVVSREVFLGEGNGGRAQGNQLGLDSRGGPRRK